MDIRIELTHAGIYAEAKEIILATYTRESTLWKNANFFYVMQDWTKMECIKVDKSEIRNSGTRYIEEETGKDVTADYTCDKYLIVLTNKRKTNHRTFEFNSREEANKFFKEEIMANPILKNFKRVQ